VFQDACVAAGSCPPAVDGWGRGTMPLVDVSWEGAKRYVAWLSQLTGILNFRIALLLTEFWSSVSARADAKSPDTPRK